MPETDWVDRTVADCLEVSFAGEWGSEPNPANALVLRATDIDDAGHVVGAGAARSIPMSKLRAKQLQDGDVLLEGSGGGPGKPVGRVALFEADSHDGPAICSNFFKTLRPKRSLVDHRFLWRKLGWFYTQPALLALQQQTTGIINLKFAEYLDARLQLPADVHEQAKIAEVLDTLDTTIRQTEAIIEKLKQVKQGLLHDLLTRGIDANGELRPPQSQAPHLYKDSPLGWIPREWAASSIDEACSDVVDCPHSTPNFLDDGVLVARTMHIKAGVFLERLASRVSEAEYVDRISRLRPEPGDVVFTREAPVGEAFVIPVGMRVCLGQRVMLLRPRPENARGQFLLAQIYSGAVADRIAALTAGTTNPHLNVAEVRQFILPLPPVAEQIVIEQQLGGLGGRIAVEGAVRDKLLTLKSGLMDDLLTGRVRVTPLLRAAAA